MAIVKEPPEFLKAATRDLMTRSWMDEFINPPADITEKALEKALMDQIKAPLRLQRTATREVFPTPDENYRALKESAKAMSETWAANAMEKALENTRITTDKDGDLLFRPAEPRETSVVDSKDIGRHLAVLRGERASGRLFSAFGHRDVVRVDTDFMGHRFADDRVQGWDHPTKCMACQIDRLDWGFNQKPCASASMPLLLAHDINHMTGNCRRCGVTMVQMQDAIADRICRSSGFEHVKFKPEMSVEKAQERIDNLVNGYLDGNGFGQIDGPPGAFFDPVAIDGEQRLGRVVYDTLRVGSRVADKDGDSAGNAAMVDNIVDLLWQEMKKRLRGRGNVVWRRRPLVEHDPDFGWRFSMRLACVGIERFIAVRDNRVVGWERDLRNGVWREKSDHGDLEADARDYAETKARDYTLDANARQAWLNRERNILAAERRVAETGRSGRICPYCAGPSGVCMCEAQVTRQMMIDTQRQVERQVQEQLVGLMGDPRKKEWM